MAALFRIQNARPLDKVALIALTIARHRRSALDAAASAELLNNVETLVNALNAIEQVPEPTLQNHEIANMQEQLTEAEQNARITDTVITDLRAQLDTARAIQERLLGTPAAAAAPALKIPDPDKFSGEKDKLREFTMQLQLKTQTIQDEQDRLRYAISRLSGPALSQVAPFIRPNNINLIDITALLRILESAFGDPDRIATAEQKIDNLKQKNKDFASYYAEFQRYASDLDWNESAKLSALRRGLSTELMTDMITMREVPRTVDELVEICQLLDNRRRAVQERLRPRANYSTTTRAIPATTTTRTTTAPVLSRTATTATGTQAGPMDLSSSRRKLTLEERQRRMTEGRCLYCGGLGHMARDCPAARRPLRGAEAIVIPPVINAVDDDADLSLN